MAPDTSQGEHSHLLPEHLYVIYQQENVLGHVEIAQVKDDGIADHGLSKDAINLQEEIESK